MNKYRFKPDHDNYGEDHVLLATLIDKPLNFSELKDNYLSIMRRLGFYDQFLFNKPGKQSEFEKYLKQKLSSMESEGLISLENDKYSLTEQGKKETDKFIEDLQKVKKFISVIYLPKTVSIISLITHFVLALIKLPAGILSGSVGLLNDAIDTLLDGVSCILVFLGIHYKKEGLANLILVIIMLATGGYTLVEGVNRFINPVTHSFNFFTFFAAIFSAVLCSLLYFYQRFIGLKSGNVSLITQSIDSRNHVIVAIGVIAGLVSSLFNFKLLDPIIGLIIAVIILKSALELLIEIFKTRSEGDVDLSQYKIFLADSYENIRKNQIKNWILYLVDKHQVNTKQELMDRVKQSLNFRKNVVLREVGLADSHWHEEIVEPVYEQLISEKLLEEEENIEITGKGQTYIRSKLKC